MEHKQNNRLSKNKREIISEESKHIENKQNVCDKLLITLRETRDFKDLVYLRYEKKKSIELVHAIFQEKKTILVNVTCDSEAALIRDVVNILIQY